MKYLSSLLIALCLIAAPATFTGCSTTDQTREAIVFYTFKDIQTIVHRAYDVFAEKVVRGKVSDSDREKVENAYVAYQDAFRTAFTVASMDLTKLTPVEVQKLANELINLIYKL